MWHCYIRRELCWSVNYNNTACCNVYYYYNKNNLFATLKSTFLLPPHHHPCTNFVTSSSPSRTHSVTVFAFFTNSTLCCISGSISCPGLPKAVEARNNQLGQDSSVRDIDRAIQKERKDDRPNEGQRQKSSQERAPNGQILSDAMRDFCKWLGK